MNMTKHDLHSNPQPGCPACRWTVMTPDQQEAHREAARLAWRQRNPEKAARRDALLAAQEPRPCACGAEDARPFVTDYAAGMISWVCRPCVAAARHPRGEHRREEEEEVPEAA